MAGKAEPGLDEIPNLVKLKGCDYLEVKWRLLWRRTEHPEATLDSNTVRVDDGYAVFKAKVTIPGASCRGQVGRKR